MNTVPQNCKSEKQAPDNSSMQLLVNEYLHKWGDSYEREDPWWREALTWEEAIVKAWNSKLSNKKMHGHQCRVARELPKGLEIALADGKQSEDLKDFHSVYAWVKSVTDRVDGLAATTAYDVARRLGVWLGLEPTAVYLHAGSGKGAEKLGVKGEIAPLSAFPKEIQSLGATHAENFLCIYKDRLSL